MPYRSQFFGRGAFMLARHRSLIRRFGLRVVVDRRFEMDGHRYMVRSSGLDAMYLINKILTSHGTSLFAFRSEIRRIQSSPPLALLSYLASRATDDRSRTVIIWLRGMCGGHLGSGKVARFRDSENPRIRWRVASALRRMHAWMELREFEEVESDPRILGIIHGPERTSYDKRLQSFLSQVDSQPVSESTTELIMTEHCSTSQDRNQKPNWLIRMFLVRIRKLVHG